MVEPPDSDLLRQYLELRSEEAFAELVRRHLAVVYRVALRQTRGDAHLAEDVAQTVFVALAREAAKLSRRETIVGWLFTATRYAGATLMRTEWRRQAREQKEMQMNLPDTAEPRWDEIRPEIDSALEQLSPRERDAVLLRFFEGLSFAAIGTMLRITEDAARMRVERAVERMRLVMTKRGISSTAAALTGALATQAAGAAPVGLAGSITGAALASGASTGMVGATLMSIPKLQVGIVAIIGLAGSAGWVSQANTNAALAAELNDLHAQNQDIAGLQSEHERLRLAAIEVAELRGDDAALKTLADTSANLIGRLKSVAAVQDRDQPDGAFNGQPVYALGKLDIVPRIKSTEAPKYPRGLGAFAGSVRLQLIIDHDGKVQNARALSATRPEFEASAIEAVRRWQYYAGEKNRRAVNAQVEITIAFKPDEPRGAR